MRTNILQAKKALLALFVLLMPLLASAQTKVEIDGIWYNLDSETKQAEVTHNDRQMDIDSGGEYYGSITIPATVTYNSVTYSVTSIGDCAFRFCYNLTAINIPEGVTSIRANAFDGCNNLTSITIPSNVTSIGGRAFAYCYGLESITIPEGVTSIERGAFYDCSNLTTINIPASVTSIGDEAFYNCSSLTVINIPESVTSIGQWAFEGCSSLTAITIPENSQLTSIGNRAFYGCNNLTSITIPSNVTSIGYSAFYECGNLTAINIPEGVTSIGQWAFDGCSSLTAITIPENSQLTSIGNYAFEDCSRLNSITIPSNVTSIGYSAFFGCSSLTAINIPESVTSIGQWAFVGCSSLTTITIPENSQLTSIWSEVFYGCSSLNSITIPSNVTSIGDRAFSGCSSLTAINIPENSQLTSIGGGAFYGCSSLTAITIPESVTSIGNSAFYDCRGLTSITCKAATPPIIGDSNTFYNVYKSIPVYVPAGSVKAYKAAEGWSKFSNIERMAVSITHITLSQSSVTLTEEETLTLTATVTPDDATDSSVTWNSSAPSVATVDNTGKVTAIAPGSVTITATANDGSGVSASCEVTVTPASYVITFLIDGEQFYTQTLTRGSTITLPEAPTKEGYTFSGWGEVPETMPAGNLTITGSYAINSYTLTYVVDGEAVLTLPFLYGGSIPSLKEPTKEGHTFSGWSEIPETMPANDVTIEGTFTQLPSVFLTINQADNGYVKQQLTAGTVCTFTIEAAEGWKIHSVTFNGEDVTSQLEEGSIYTTPEMLEDAVLNIAYEQEVPESVENAHARAIKVRGLDNTIHISGLAEGTTVTLYTTDGTMVAHQQSSAGEAKFTVDTNQVYLVHIGDKVVKIGM